MKRVRTKMANLKSLPRRRLPTTPASRSVQDRTISRDPRCSTCGGKGFLEEPYPSPLYCEGQSHWVDCPDCNETRRLK